AGIVDASDAKAGSGVHLVLFGGRGGVSIRADCLAAGKQTKRRHTVTGRGNGASGSTRTVTPWMGRPKDMPGRDISAWRTSSSEGSAETRTRKHDDPVQRASKPTKFPNFDRGGGPHR